MMLLSVRPAGTLMIMLVGIFSIISLQLPISVLLKIQMSGQSY